MVSGFSLKNNMPTEEIKPEVNELKMEKDDEGEKKFTPLKDETIKSSMEILSELFECFDAEPPIIVKKEKDDNDKKKKKSKKKHKHKDKKHKKKDKKRKRSSSSSSEGSAVDLGEILIKQENDVLPKIKIEGTEKAIEINFNGNNKTKSDDKETMEEGEIIDIKQEKNDNDRNKVKTKHKTRSKSDDRKDKEKHKAEKHKSREKSKEKEKRNRSRSRDSDFYKPRDRNDDFYRVKDRKSRLDDFYRSQDRRRSRSFDKTRRDYKSRSSERKRLKVEEDFYKSSREKYNREREKRHKERINYIDKKKLLEIARKNAIQMMKSGSLPAALTLGPQAQEKVIAAIKAGGKTIEELTEFCKTLSKQEAMGELSSGPEENGSDNETAFHHPFQIKDRPTSITMNIKNSVPLPIKSTQERTTELRMQFPVSSGQLHRKTESEWVPVPPKETPIEEKIVQSVEPLLVEPPPPPQSVLPVPTMVPPPQTSDLQNVDISSIVSQRLTAIRKLQENPNDPKALSDMSLCNKEMQFWAQSKQQPGQFTGSTGANIMSQAELSSGYQAWARKDQLQSATPVSGGMGMHLLQKMGWKPGEGLGKEKTGALEPLLLEVKLDKKGLVANEEQKKRKKQQNQYTNNKSLLSKHPVSLLGEFASKKKLGAPEYILCFECGPDHKKNFLFKVILNGVEYKPNIASPNKKEAKAAAASVCLQNLGLLPTVPINAPSTTPP